MFKTTITALAVLASAVLLALTGTAYACDGKEDAKRAEPNKCIMICESRDAISNPIVRIDVIPDPKHAPNGKDCAVFFQGLGFVDTKIGQLPIVASAASSIRDLMEILGGSWPEPEKCKTPDFQVPAGVKLFACNLTRYPLQFTLNHHQDTVNRSH